MYTKALTTTAVTALILAASGPALGQSVDPAAPSSQLDEIIVTARKASENLQDVPLSISAFTADDLQRAESGKPRISAPSPPA